MINDPNPAPDSQVPSTQEIEIFETPLHENPQHGAATIRLRNSPGFSQSMRVSKATASSLLRQLAAYLGEECEACEGRGEIGRMTFEGGESMPCTDCRGLGAHP